MRVRRAPMHTRLHVSPRPRTGPGGPRATGTARHHIAHRPISSSTAKAAVRHTKGGRAAQDDTRRCTGSTSPAPCGIGRRHGGTETAHRPLNSGTVDAQRHRP